jgi:hypothetical protein
MYVVERAPIVASRALSMQEVERAIRDAGTNSGWQMIVRGPGEIEGHYAQSASRAVVSVTFDTATYNIRYKDSVNLRYEGDKTSGEKISIHYNNWVQMLDQRIRAQMSNF